MRILQVRFKNLNSLVGEWQIDLTHPAYTSDGIFAITGPTGAGKTTILDAICLALYGRTPRLTRVSKSVNEALSRQTGECFAEVTFETQTGRYRCHWSQHRARNKADGELQAPKHEIANADSGEIFESKIKGVAEQIESVTGMDFDRFTRSMLLAQGGFAVFLQATPDNRAPILEQITGTEIYSRISIRVHERQHQERETLKELQIQAAGIVILDPQQEKEMQQILETRQQEETDLAAKAADTAKAMTWLTTIEGLKQEIAGLADEAGELQNRIEAFQPLRQKLEQALRAASLDGTYASLTAIRKQQQDDREALLAAQAALPELESFAAEQARSLKNAEQQTVQAKKELQAAAPLIQKVRALDQKLDDQKKAILEEKELCSRDQEKIDADIESGVALKEKHSRAQNALEQVDGYLAEHAQDEWLISGLTGVEEQFGGLLGRQKEIVQKKAEKKTAVTNLEQATKARDDCQKQCSIHKQELEDASKRLLQSRDALSQLLGDRLLREYRAEKDALLRERLLLANIAELEAHRAKLQDGQPCPLCGATEHPFAAGNVPVPDETEIKIESLEKLISQAEDLETAIQNLLTAEASAREKLTTAEKQEMAATRDTKEAEKTLAEVNKSLAEICADFEQRKQAVSVKLLPLGITEIPDSDVESLLDSLKARQKAWRDRVREKAEIDKQIADLDSEMNRLRAVILTQRTALDEKRKRLAILEKDYTAKIGERKELYGDKNPDTEERRLNEAVKDAERAEKRARDLHSEREQNRQTAKTRVESLEKRIDQQEPKLQEREAEFASALSSAGFGNEAQFSEARMSSEQREKLAAQSRELDEHRTALETRQKDRKTRLEAEQAKEITDKSLDELDLQFKASETTLKELRESIAGLSHQLRENITARERIKEKQTAIAAQKKECLKWDNLHALIGSADGKKYRNFAQGLTFEMMIGHANRQLQKMTDRYLLIRDQDQPLELDVIDNYQAGEIRSTKNLSGGESFIVSLALALGLSHMASKKVRVDSLFLDEGFGSLDEEALDIALETLTGLQQDGKLIGIISHVPALKERISTQIQVTPQTGGRSRIVGPGCSRVSDAEALVTGA
ncbi:AAA family ATPase [candidate division KSB1 bacterium]|nr:AAA family ATPase [candidate division KSB1 bacterium]